MKAMVELNIVSANEERKVDTEKVVGEIVNSRIFENFAKIGDYDNDWVTLEVDNIEENYESMCSLIDDVSDILNVTIDSASIDGVFAEAFDARWMRVKVIMAPHHGFDNSPEDIYNGNVEWLMHYGKKTYFRAYNTMRYSNESIFRSTISRMGYDGRHIGDHVYEIEGELSYEDLNKIRIEQDKACMVYDYILDLQEFLTRTKEDYAWVHRRSFEHYSRHLDKILEIRNS